MIKGYIMITKNVVLIKENTDSIDLFIEKFPVTSYPEYCLKQVIENLEDILLIKDPMMTTLFNGNEQSVINNIALRFNYEFSYAEYLVIVNDDDIVAVDINDILSLTEVLLVCKEPNVPLVDTVKKECKMIVNLDKL